MDEDWNEKAANVSSFEDDVEESCGSAHKAGDLKSGRWEAVRLAQVAMVVFLYMLAISMLLPAYPALLLEAFNGDDGAAAQWQGMLMGIKSVLELIAAPLIGAYSDQHGRKQILIFSVAVQGIFLRVAVPRFLSKENCVILSNFLHFAGFVLYGMCTQGWMLYTVLVTTASACIGDPTMIAVMASFVQPESQGAFQGALHSLKTLAHAFGAPLFSTIFAYFIGDSFVERAGFSVPGAAFFSAGLLSFAAFLICVYIFKFNESYRSGKDHGDTVGLLKKDDTDKDTEKGPKHPEKFGSVDNDQQQDAPTSGGFAIKHRC